MPPHSIRVLIAADDDLFGTGLAGFLDTYAELIVVGTATNGAEALEQCGKLHPDVVLMNVSDGLEAAQLIRLMYPRIGMVMLSHPTEDNQKRETTA
jgi:NarL family two-component system response regulator LiaR